MVKLCQALKSKRVADKDQGEKQKKTEKKEKEKAFVLEEATGKENNLFCSDIKIVKKTPKKVMSDLSQIYNRPKKVKKTF